jgi:methylamine--corrinoid protein Co-methyltransferase
MIPLIDFQRRALTGPVMKADDFDIEFSMKVRELVAEYEIAFNEDELIVDDPTADAVFQAGVELLTEIGLYHLDTERVIKYTREEVLDFIAESKRNPAQVKFGRGNDEMVIQYRTSDSTTPPVNYAGMGGVAEPEWFIESVQCFIQEESIQGIGIVPGLAQLGDLEPVAGTMSEVEVGLWEQKALKEAAERAGRPDINLGLLCTVTSIGGTMALIGPGLREAYNTQIGIHIMPEQKIDWTRLVLTQFCHARGIIPWQSSMSLLGGLCRGAADSAVALTANMLGQFSYAHGPTISFFPNHMDGSWATKDTLWAFSAAARASERNLKLAAGSAIAGNYASGKGIVPFWEEVATVLVYVASGLGYAWILGRTGFEASMLNEVMKAVSGMPREQANQLAQEVMEKVQSLLPPEDFGMSVFPELYDVKSVTPKPEHKESILRAMDELAAMGLTLA